MAPPLAHVLPRTHRRTQLLAGLPLGLKTLWGLWLVFALGLALPTAIAKPGLPPSLPQNALAVPNVRQTRDFSCGPAALLAVLRYFGYQVATETALYRPLGTTAENGTLPEALAQGARRFGLKATVRQPMTLAQLRAAVDGGKPVILELQAWRKPATRHQSWRDTWDDGHYVVLVGVDREYVYLMDPSTEHAYTYLSHDELVARWHDVNTRQGVSLRDHRLGVVVWGPQQRPARPRASRGLVKLE